MGKDEEYNSLREVIDEAKQPTFSLDDTVEIASIGVRLGREVRDMHRPPFLLSRVDQLFKDMSKQKYKPIFEPVLQEIYQDLGKSDRTEQIRVVISDYMEKYRFRVPVSE